MSVIYRNIIENTETSNITEDILTFITTKGYIRHITTPITFIKLEKTQNIPYTNPFILSYLVYIDYQNNNPILMTNKLTPVRLEEISLNNYNQLKNLIDVANNTPNYLKSLKHLKPDHITPRQITNSIMELDI